MREHSDAQPLAGADRITDAELSTRGNRSNDAEPHRGINRHNAEEYREQVLAGGMQTWPKPGCVATRLASPEVHEER